jgi:hypothetical protein
MTQADSVLSTPRTDSPAENTLRSLLKLEVPLRTARGLAYAVECFANSDELDAEAGNALDCIARALLNELAGIKEEWEAVVAEMQQGAGK